MIDSDVKVVYISNIISSNHIFFFWDFHYQMLEYLILF